MPGGTLPLRALGSGSGKSSLVREMAAHVPCIGLVHLDACYQHDPSLAPSMPSFGGAGRIVWAPCPRRGIGGCAYLPDVSPETLDIRARLGGVWHAVGGTGPYLE